FPAIASVNSYRCYTCNSLQDKDCYKPQSPNNSVFYDCDLITKDAPCAKVSLILRGTAIVTRSCILRGETCDDIKKAINERHIELTWMTDCKICKGDFCNAD
ncbi:unnamed protein product, partial [Callosobruchus maculatus]